MKSYLCITVRFLQPFCHARGEGDELEWPPSPLRLFQAIVAATAARWNERAELEYARAALQWLEGQPAPLIVAATARPAQAMYRLYVPDNVGDKVAASWCRGGAGDIADYRAEKAVRQTYLDTTVVHYLYSIEQADGQFPKHGDTLVAAARSITHLGWGIDMVAGNALVLSEEDARNLDGEQWQTTTGAATNQLRVPIIGTLRALSQRHKLFLAKFADNPKRPIQVPPLSPGFDFRRVSYRRVTDPPPRQFVPFRLRHPTDEEAAPFSMTRANCVAAMTRHATAKIAKQQRRSDEWIDRYVHGHRNGADESLPRFSYLPLPTISPGRGGALSVGAIRRVLVAELTATPESHLAWVRQMLPGQFLTDDKTGERKAMLAPLGSDWVLQQYTGKGDTWASVTPVVLPGSDDGKLANAEKLFAKALRHAGYSADAVANIEFRNVSFWPGADLALRYRRPDYLKNNFWSVYHMRVRWKTSINGPLAIGAGRHCGLGIFALWKE